MVSSHVLANPVSFLGNDTFKNKEGNHECVLFSQQSGGAPLTLHFVKGPALDPNNPPPLGTRVGTAMRMANLKAISDHIMALTTRKRYGFLISLIGWAVSVYCRIKPER